MVRRKRTSKKAAFLAAYAECGNVTHAAKLAKCSRSQVYEWLRDDQGFSNSFDEAGEQAVELMEQEARRRAVNGTTRPIYQGGVKVGAIREYSDTLLIFLLKAARPEKYRERFDHGGKVAVEHSGAVRVTVEDLLNEPTYLDYLRSTRFDADCDAGHDGGHANGRALENGQTPGLPGYGNNGHHHGTNGKHAGG